VLNEQAVSGSSVRLPARTPAASREAREVVVDMGPSLGRPGQPVGEAGAGAGVGVGVASVSTGPTTSRSMVTSVCPSPPRVISS
jgi:hypothetical protein